MSTNEKQKDAIRKTSPVRSRSLEQVKRFLALGTATGVTLGLTHCPVVCDPLPPPVQCTGNPPSSAFDRFIMGDATWTAITGGWAVNVRLEPVRDQGDITFGANPTATGGTISQVVVGGDAGMRAIAFLVTPDAGATQVDVTVPLDCRGNADRYEILLDVSGTPSAGSPVPFTPAQ